ncbi:MAG: methyltransferase [Halioglobus sp.]
MNRRKSWPLAAGLLAAMISVMSAAASADSEALDRVIEARGEADRARDDARHPAATLAFFRVEPGMTVAEGLPGAGWYTRILANYLGKDGTLYGVNYPEHMWPLFGRSDEWVAERRAATGKFVDQVRGFTDNGISARGFTFDTVPAKIAGSVDRVLLIRALHNLNRFEQVAGTRSQALAAVRGMLKEDGLVGVVQHRLPESAPDEGADGSRGYLKQSAVIDMFEKAGFELVASSEINANPKDQPGANDIVWRLPPSLSTSKENPELRAAMEAIGESDRMTLLFRKAP